MSSGGGGGGSNAGCATTGLGGAGGGDGGSGGVASDLQAMNAPIRPTAIKATTRSDRPGASFLGGVDKIESDTTDEPTQIAAGRTRPSHPRTCAPRARAHNPLQMQAPHARRDRSRPWPATIGGL